MADIKGKGNLKTLITLTDNIFGQKYPAKLYVDDNFNQFSNIENVGNLILINSFQDNNIYKYNIIYDTPYCTYKIKINLAEYTEGFDIKVNYDKDSGTCTADLPSKFASYTATVKTPPTINVELTIIKWYGIGGGIIIAFIIGLYLGLYMLKNKFLKGI